MTSSLTSDLTNILHQVQNSNNFSLNEGASLAEEEGEEEMTNMEEVDEVVVPMVETGGVEKQY